MLVTFKSKATDSITMFGNVAVQLLKFMGATGNVPGGLSAEDVPAALAALERGVAQARSANEQNAPQSAPRDTSQDARADDERDRELPVDIATRAVPLVAMLKRAANARAGITWEATK